MDPLLEVKNLKVQFNTLEGVVHAVNGVSFSLDQGKTLGIVGESGCGKSVTILSLMRFIPETSWKDCRRRGASQGGKPAGENQSAMRRFAAKKSPWSSRIR